MLISNKIVWFNQSIVIVFLVFILYAQNVLTYNDQIDQNTIDRTNQNASKRVPYDSIYYMEHNVSQGDAKQSFFDIGIKLIDDKPSGWCMPCTAQIIEYCLNERKMLHDHCCCDSRHKQEQIPWLPHSCYVGDRCQPTIGSCINYTEIRECCCDRELAKRWKEIFSSSTMTTVNVFTQLVCVFLYVASRSLN